MNILFGIISELFDIPDDKMPGGYYAAAPHGPEYPRIIGEDPYTRATIVETSPRHYTTMSEAEAKEMCK